MDMQNTPQDPSGEVVLEIENASFFYEESGERYSVLQNVNLMTHASEICAIVGPSGCGKTTLIKLAISLLPLSEGSVKLFGRDAGDPSVGIPGPNVGYMPQEDALPSDLRVRDSLYFFGLLNNMSISDIRKRMDEVLEQVDLVEDSGKFVFQLSGGMKRRLSLALSLLHSPQLLILDEPTVGCDPVLRSRIWSVLKQISSENRTSIVITTHYIEECRLADTVNFMREKKFALQTRPREIMYLSSKSSLDEAFFEVCFSDHSKLISAEAGKCILSSSGKYSTNTRSPIHRSISLLKIILILILRYAHAYVFNPATLATIVFVPTVATISIHTCTTTRVLGVPIGLVVENQTFFYDEKIFDQLGLKPKCFECLHPRHFVEHMNLEALRVVPYQDLEIALEDATAGKISGVVDIGGQFLDHFLYRVTTGLTDLQENSARNTIIKFYGDAGRRLVFGAIHSYLLDAYRKYLEISKFNLGIENDTFVPFEYGDPILDRIKDNTHDKNYFSDTGLFMANTFPVSISLGGFLMLKELQDKTMKRCLATGLKTYHLFASQLIANGLFAGLSAILSMFSVIYLLELPVELNSFLAAGSIALTANVLGVVFGQMIALGLGSEITMTLISISTSFLIGSLMGGAFSLESQPYYTKTFSHFLPLTIPIIGFRGALIRGFSFTNLIIVKSLVIPLLYLIVFSLITFSLLNKNIQN